MQKRVFHIGTVPFSANNKVTLDVPRTGVITKFNFRPRYSVTSGSSAMVGPLLATLARVLRRVDFNVNGRDLLFSHSGEMLALRAQYEGSTPPDGLNDTFVLTGSTTTTAYDLTIPLPRFLPRSARPLMCADDIRRVNQATLEFTFGDIDNLVTTPNGASIAAGAVIDVEVEYLLGVDPNTSFNVREMWEIEEPYTGASDNFAITVDNKTGVVMRSIALAMTDAYVGSNALLNNLKVQSGTANVFYTQRAGALQGDNKTEFVQANLVPGFYFRDLTAFGDPTTGIDTGALTADLQTVLDVSLGSGTSRATLSLEAIRPLVA